MINYSFRNQAEFNEIFGLRTTGDGKLVRQNKILLAMIKNRECHKTFSWLKDTKTTSKIFEYLLSDLSRESFNCGCSKNIAITINGNFYRFYNEDYNMDEQCGICEDCDASSYRYIKDGRIYKMKIGKLFAKVLAENPKWEILPEQVKVFFLEENLVVLMRLDLEEAFPDALVDLPEDLPAALPAEASGVGFAKGISASTIS